MNNEQTKILDKKIKKDGRELVKKLRKLGFNQSADEVDYILHSVGGWK